MYYWYNLSCGNESIIRPFAGDIVTIYAMDKTIGAIQTKYNVRQKHGLISITPMMSM